MTKSWKTTALGIMTCLSAIISVAQPLIDNEPMTQPDFATAAAMFMAGIGLIFAKDSNVSGTGTDAVTK